MSRQWSALKEIALRDPDLEALPAEVLRDMLAEGDEIRECYRVLKKGGANIVGEVLRGQGTFYEFDHYPSGDVYDEETGSQFYYHAHRGLPGEHGHFHTFVRARGMPEGVAPVAYDGEEAWPTGDDALCHLVAISMDVYGFPLGIFATNRWVTDEAWYAAPDAIRIAERFDIDHAVPSWPTNRWITAFVRLFRPQIAALLEHRDAVVAAWRELHPDRDVYEDRDLETTGWLRVSVDEQLERVRAALGAP